LSKKEKYDIVEIEIYDQRYPLRLSTPAEREEILKLAEMVDHRMREIAEQTGTVDSLRVAILTALHLAEETRQMDGGSKKLESSVRTGAKKLIAAIEKEL
jgi:cell division protein ZapA